MKTLISLIINDELHELAVEHQTTLLEALRDQLGLTGAKEGCGTGECGTCTVLVDDKPILSCLTLAVDCEDVQITTIEGLAQGDKLHLIQEAFINHGAVECGFCIPARVMMAKALLDENPDPSREEVKLAMQGILCADSGYVKQIEAVEIAAGKMRGGE